MLASTFRTLRNTNIFLDDAKLRLAHGCRSRDGDVGALAYYIPYGRSMQVFLGQSIQRERLPYTMSTSTVWLHIFAPATQYQPGRHSRWLDTRGS